MVLKLVLFLTLIARVALALQRGDSCVTVGASCTDDYKLVCTTDKKCDCRPGTLFSQGKCISTQLYHGCNDGADPPCSQFPGAICDGGWCACPKDWFANSPQDNTCSKIIDANSTFVRMLNCTGDQQCGAIRGTCDLGKKACVCSVGMIRSSYKSDWCESVLKMPCSRLGVYEKCTALPHASCRVPTGLSAPVCTCGSGFVASNNLCVKVSEVTNPQTTNDNTKVADPCTQVDAPCNSSLTLFCDGPLGNLTCGCRMNQKLQNGQCVSNKATEDCGATKTSIEGVCQGVLGKPCNYGDVPDKCSKIPNASCAFPEGLVTPLCMCAAGSKPSDSEEACDPADPAPVYIQENPTSSSQDGSSGQSDKGGGGEPDAKFTKIDGTSNMGLIIGLSTGFSLVGIGILICVLSRYAKKLKKASDASG